MMLIVSNIHDLGAKPGNEMMFGDTSRRGVPFSKDPHVIHFQDRYMMYYSIPPYTDKTNDNKGWGIGIAESKDLVNWIKIGEIIPREIYEAKGICAPCALVIKDTVHLFYQTYGNRENDAICHAFSQNGIDFVRNSSNPVFRPRGDWTIGRAIDAEVIRLDDKYLLYFATRDTSMSVQMLGVAAAPLNTGFSRNDWQQLTDHPILEPRYPWERNCVEGASVIRSDNFLYMFYAGAYNNEPQQIGVAKSRDGIGWTKLSKEPFLSNGKPGEWNSSESGHPHIFEDSDGRTYLFFQGNNDNGKTWHISKVEIGWTGQGPYIIQ
ncbi:family 43 glycosylhydrolase [Candidatus Neomarinimicrobiota bacterium]